MRLGDLMRLLFSIFVLSFNGRPTGLQPDCEMFYILAASPRRAAGLRPDCQRFYILPALPRSATGLRPDCQKVFFYISAYSATCGWPSAGRKRSAGLSKILK